MIFLFRVQVEFVSVIYYAIHMMTVVLILLILDVLHNKKAHVWLLDSVAVAPLMSCPVKALVVQHLVTVISIVMKLGIVVMILKILVVTRMRLLLKVCLFFICPSVINQLQYCHYNPIYIFTYQIVNTIHPSIYFS